MNSSLTQSNNWANQDLSASLDLIGDTSTFVEPGRNPKEEAREQRRDWALRVAQALECAVFNAQQGSKNKLMTWYRARTLSKANEATIRHGKVKLRVDYSQSFGLPESLTKKDYTEALQILQQMAQCNYPSEFMLLTHRFLVKLQHTASQAEDGGVSPMAGDELVPLCIFIVSRVNVVCVQALPAVLALLLDFRVLVRSLPGLEVMYANFFESGDRKSVV